jgi:acetyltransferase-like isoleucine patch superfamily enzyme
MPIVAPGSRSAWLVSRSIAFLPFGALRRLMYRLCFGYSLRHARVGFGTIIDVRSFRADGACIGRFNRFHGPMSVSIGRGAMIGDRNTFSCPEWATREPIFIGKLEIGGDCLLTGLHFFDVAGAVTLGAGAWIAGRGTEIWTHGAGSADNTVSVGARSYVGSGCRFAPGSAVGAGCLVALGSVVTSRLEANDALIGGVPAKILKQPYAWPSKRP